MTLAPILVAVALASPYSTGERMAYSIDYLGMRAGIASISVGQPGDHGVPVKLEAHTTGITRAVYNLRESLVSWLAPESGLPTYFEIDIKENDWKHYDTTAYDRVGGVAIVIQRGKTTSTDKVAIAPDALDFVALVFQLRRADLEPGMRRAFTVLAGTDVHAVIVEVMEREKVKTKAGTFTAFKIRVPTGFTGKFSEKNPTYLWISDDPRRVVVKITTDFSFGSGEANLLSYTPGESSAVGEAADGPAPPSRGAATTSDR